jgi:hypothetical protein
VLLAKGLSAGDRWTTKAPTKAPTRIQHAGGWTLVPPHAVCSHLAEPVALCLKGCSLGRAEAAHRCHRRRPGRWLLSRARCPALVEAAAPRFVWASIASLLWHGLLSAYALCLGRLLSGRARHLTVPRSSPCTSCGCGRIDRHAHIHSWCTKIPRLAASV